MCRRIGNWTITRLLWILVNQFEGKGLLVKHHHFALLFNVGNYFWAGGTDFRAPLRRFLFVAERSFDSCRHLLCFFQGRSSSRPVEEISKKTHFDVDVSERRLMDGLDLFCCFFLDVIYGSSERWGYFTWETEKCDGTSELRSKTGSFDRGKQNMHVLVAVEPEYKICRAGRLLRFKKAGFTDAEKSQRIIKMFVLLKSSTNENLIAPWKFMGEHIFAKDKTWYMTNDWFYVYTVGWVYRSWVTSWERDTKCEASFQQPTERGKRHRRREVCFDYLLLHLPRFQGSEWASRR